MSTKEISVIGLDLAKTVFQVHGIDRHGAVVVTRQLRRAELSRYFARIKPCLIGMEACGSAHYWARVLTDFGHTVRLMAPQFVKPYLKGNKNDARDAEAICEAVQRPSMRFVTPKAPEQQALLHLHRSRELLIGQRVALSNHMRGLLSEFGQVISTGDRALRTRVPEILEDAQIERPGLTRRTLCELQISFQQLVTQIDRLTAEIEAWHRDSDASQRLAAVPGIGVLTATALVATVGDATSFSNGRQLAAFLGLVPRQASSGGKQRLLGISKRGDGYVRRLLVQGAKSVIRYESRRLKANQPLNNAWLRPLLQRSHSNKVAVALANKMARITWVLLTREEDYQPAGSI